MKQLWLCVLALGCKGPGADSAPDRRQEVIQSLAQDPALARMLELEARAAALSTAVVGLCATPDTETLAAAQAAWWSAHEPLKRLDILQFGPMVEYPDRLRPLLDDSPVNDAAVEALVAGEGTLDQAAFDTMGSATRGFPVVEYLLWAPADGVLGALGGDPRRCAVLVGAAADVATNSGRLVTAWTGGWMARLSQPEAHPDDAYDTVQDVLDEWVNRMAFTAENIRSTKLGKPVGDSSGGEPQPDALESPFSARSLLDARDALTGVADVWAGGAGPGIRVLVEDPALAERVDELLAQSAERLAAVPEPLADTITVQPEVVAWAQEALRALQVAAQVELAQALGVTVTFNDNDGD